MRILMASDFGLFGKAQIELLRRLNCGVDTKVKVLHVIEPLCWELQSGYPSYMQLSDNIINECRDAALKLVHDVAANLKRQTAIENIEAEVREGSISNEIVDAAESFAADLVVVGSHGKSGIARLLLGSTSQSVSTNAKCSVLIARLPEPTDESNNETSTQNKRRNNHE